MTGARLGPSLVRVGGWWYPMIAPLAALAYLQVEMRAVPPGAGLGRLAALVASAAALAAYGHVLNDLADLEADRAAGRTRALARLPPAGRAATVAALVVAGAVPWLLVDLPAAGVALLVLIYALPILYSLPPVRLKERGLAGVVTDAVNAHVAPALFTVALFADEGSLPVPLPVVGAATALWSLGFGLRAILAHQIVDAANDRASGIRTFVTTGGEERARRLMTRLAFPVEVVGGAALAVVVAVAAWPVAAAFVAYGLVFQAARRTGVWSVPWSPAPDEGGYVTLLEWYEVWPGLLLLGSVVGLDPLYAVVAVVHVAVFWRGLRKQGGDLVRLLQGLVGRARSARRGRSG